MGKKLHINLSLITILFGFMISTQYLTVKNPVVKETRDINKLRDDLKKEQEIQLQLISENRKYDEQLLKYSKSNNEDPESAIKEVIQQLEKNIGLTEVTGKGITFTIEPLFGEELLGEEVPQLSSELLVRFLNEIKMLGATDIAVGDERIIATTGIREVNGRTMVNNSQLADLPLTISIFAIDSNKLYKTLQVSPIIDDFAIENLQLKISKPNIKVSLPSFDNDIKLKGLSPVSSTKEKK
ncbi:MAG: NgoFVII family restriction endonuclease [Bacillales bacterium]|nr:NgoFVII family restriction endonuclease [Bacillales bacterium]